MKKILTVLLSVVLIGAMPLAFTGCGKSTSGGGDGEKLVIHFGSTQGKTTPGIRLRKNLQRL